MSAILGATISAPIIPLSVVEVPTDVTGYGNTGSAANITTGLVKATAAGGSPPYSYAWTQTGSSPYTWTISAPTAASTAFTCNTLGPGNTAQVEFTVTITDAANRTVKGAITAFANNGQPYDDRARSTGIQA